MTKAELVTEIAIQTGYDKTTIGIIVESMMHHIKKAVANDNNVYLRGFGSFTVKERKEKVARNIVKKTSIVVPAHLVPAFKPSPEFKEALNSK
ncbi:MAG: integration host factor subunit beta [Paludibacteraceae bacterium]|nr:integration host factor subunit beta [Paludibacteraceae bacterium]